MDCRLLELDDADAVGELTSRGVRRMPSGTACCRTCTGPCGVPAGAREPRIATCWGCPVRSCAPHCTTVRGVDYDAVPAWQRYGVGLYHESYEKTGVNPVTGESRVALRRRIVADYELPYGPGHYGLVVGLLVEGGEAE